MARKRLRDPLQFSGVPMPRGLALVLKDARAHGWSGTVVSADRRKGRAEKYGRMSQAALYAAWVWWLAKNTLPPGWTSRPNPANPPGRSTHELRSDGVAYRGPVGRPLAWHQLGLDVTEAPELVAVLNRIGYEARRPYSDPREAHHVNLYRNPWRRLRKRGLWGRRKPKPPSRVSAKGLNLIARFEGFRAEPYNDAANHATIGYGHLLHHGPVTAADRKRWGKITVERGRELLRADAKVAEDAVVNHVTVSLTQPQFDALVSFVFNIGVGAFRDSTLLHKLNAGEYRAAADQLLRWTKAGGQELPGLVIRRKAERALFLS